MPGALMRAHSGRLYFYVTHELELESAPGVARTVLSRLDPAAVLVDADPAPKKGDEWN